MWLQDGIFRCNILCWPASKWINGLLGMRWILAPGRMSKGSHRFPKRGNFLQNYIHIIFIYSHPWPRLTIFVVMQELPNAMNVLAPDCGSWGVPARGTSRRNWMNFVGMVNYDFGRRGNQMVSRCFDCMTFKVLWTPFGIQAFPNLWA